MRRSPVLLTLSGALVLALPAAAAVADCPATAKFSGSLRTAEFSGGGGVMGPRRITVGDPVTAGRVQVGEQYYVPKGKSASLRLHGYRQRASGGTVFLVQCDIWDGKTLYFRLLDGKVRVSGKRFTSAKGAPAGSWVVTPDATMSPLPGRPGYTAQRRATDTARTTRSWVDVGRGRSAMFVKIHGPAAAGRQIPCQAGKRITVFGNGRYRNG